MYADFSLSLPPNALAGQADALESGRCVHGRYESRVSTLEFPLQRISLKFHVCMLRTRVRSSVGPRGVGSLQVGFLLNSHPVSFFCSTLLRACGIGPEIEWSNQPLQGSYRLRVVRLFAPKLRTCSLRSRAKVFRVHGLCASGAATGKFCLYCVGGSFCSPWCPDL